MAPSRAQAHRDTGTHPSLVSAHLQDTVAPGPTAVPFREGEMGNSADGNRASLLREG